MSVFSGVSVADRFRPFPSDPECYAVGSPGLGHDWGIALAYEHGFQNAQTSATTGNTEPHRQDSRHLMLTWFF